MENVASPFKFSVVEDIFAFPVIVLVWMVWTCST